MVQNVFTFAKVASLLGLAVFGFLLGRNPQVIAANFGHFWNGATFELGDDSGGRNRHGGPAVFVRCLEQRDLRRRLKCAIRSAICRFRSGLGVGVVSALYLACNFVYLSVLTLPQIQTAPEDRVATASCR